MSIERKPEKILSRESFNGLFNTVENRCKWMVLLKNSGAGVA